MKFESFPNKEEAVRSPVEGAESSTIDKLNSLGIHFEHIEGPEGTSIFKFSNVREAERGASWLDANDKNVLLKSIHFEDGKFRDLVDKKESSAEDLFKAISEKFSEADQIIYSCCHPDSAKKAIENLLNKPIIIGSGDSEYNTMFDNRLRNSITVSPSIE